MALSRRGARRCEFRLGWRHLGPQHVIPGEGEDASSSFAAGVTLWLRSTGGTLFGLRHEYLSGASEPKGDASRRADLLRLVTPTRADSF